MRKRTIGLSLAALTIVGSLVVGPAAPAGLERMSAGTVVFIHDQEPPSLRGGWLDNNLLATGLVTNNIWYGGQIYDNRARLQLRLLETKPKLVKANPQTVTFKYKASAVWSDGKPVTCEDWRATWKVFVNPQFNVVSRAGYQDIKSVTCNGKAGTIVFRTPYAAWETLVSGGVYAAHVIRGKNMNQQFNNSIPVSSGPWKFQSWQRGVQMTLVKNPRFKVGPPLKLDRVVFRYIVDTNARFQALKAGDGHVMEPQPQLQIADFLKDSNFVVDRKIGFAWEHIDIQFGAKGHPALKQAYVRQALITGMNRPQIANALYGTISPGLKVTVPPVILIVPTAPCSMQNFFLASSETTPIARPPSARVISSASEPSPPAAPHTRTASPFSTVCGGQPISMRYAVDAQRRKQPAASHVSRGGLGRHWCACARANWQ